MIKPPPAESKAIRQLQQTVWDYYAAHGRHDLPWRQASVRGGQAWYDPYGVLVSELMLQQTQVSRVVPKYVQFMQRFASTKALADAPLGEVLVAWQGLGYNRRAKYLWQAARQICDHHGGQLPRNLQGLTSLPGVGSNTAGAIMAYAYGLPAVFVETNIRSVYLHHFFAGQTGVPDIQVLRLVADSLPEPALNGGAKPSGSGRAGNANKVRQWYWALMDYGSHLKQTVGNTARASRSYSRQAPFAGSRRQVRGAVIRALAAEPHTAAQLRQLMDDERLEAVLDDLCREGLVVCPAPSAKGQPGAYTLA